MLEPMVTLKTVQARVAVAVQVAMVHNQTAVVVVQVQPTQLLVFL
jgi:hypothetical protein